MRLGRIWARQVLRAVASFSVLTFVLLASTQSATAAQLGLKPLSLAGPMAFVRSLFATGPSVPAQGRGHGGAAASTKANRGSGHAPGSGAGQLAADKPTAPTAKVGKSGTVYSGFDAKSSTRVASRSTVNTTWYQNQDGSLTERLSQQPVNYRDASGAWQVIDASLVKGGDGRWHQRANGFGLSFAGGAGVSVAAESLSAVGAGALKRAATAQAGSSQGQLVDLTLGGSGGESIAWSLSGAALVSPTVSADGTTTSYPGILPDTTLQLASESYGVTESLVLASATAPSSWTFPLSLSGVALVQGSDGVWQLVDASGTVVAVLDSPNAVDANVDPHSGEAPETGAVAYSLATVNGVEQLTMTLDPAWLADPARVFPVTVDPNVSVSIAGQQQSTYMDNNYPDQNYLNYGNESKLLKIGNDSAGNFDESLLMYPSGVAGTGYHISAAQFAAFDQHAWNTASSYGYTVYAAGCPTTAMCWSPSTVTWNKWNQAGAGTQSTLGSWGGNSRSMTCDSLSGRWEYTDLSADAMNNFSARGYSWFGLLLTTPGQTTDDNYWKILDSSQVGSCSPYISLTYTPDVAPQVDSMSPLDGTAVSTLAPQLTATGHDPDAWPNAAVQYHFSVFPSTGGAAVADSGSSYQSSGVWAVPPGKLAWGKTYQWTVDVYDGFTTETTRTYNTFTTTAPPPVLTGGLSQSSDGHGFSASLGNYTTSATDADVATVGPSLQVQRDYNSLDSRTAGAFGAAWSSVLDAKATQVLDSTGTLIEVVVTYPDGSQVVFAANSDGSFAPPAGRYATFVATKDANKNLTGYTLADKDGTVYTFGHPLSSTGSAPAFGITSVADKLARTVSFAWSTSPGGAITTQTSGVSGRSLHFAWFTPSNAANPHVQSVKTDDATAGNDATAQLWTYRYAGDELAAVCAPTRTNPSVSESSACTAYTYSGYSDYQNGVLDGNPSSYWPLSDASGSTSAASRAPGNAGTDVGTYSNVVLGGANSAHLAGSTANTASFNGSNSYVTLPSSLLINRTYLSVALWFRTTAAGGILFCEQNTAIGSTPGNATASLYIGTDGKLYGAWYAGSSSAAVSVNTVTDGAWHFVVLSGSGNSQSMYLDGDGTPSKVTQSGNTGPINNLGQSYTYVGAGYSSGVWPKQPAVGWNYFNGSISDVSYYTRGLTSTEAQGLNALGTHSSAFLTDVARPSAVADPTKASAAHIVYDTATGRASRVTDANGAVWSLSTPSSAGSDQVYKAAVLAQAPESYWRFGDPAGTTNPIDQINNDAWSGTAGQAAYNGATLGNAGVFSGSTAAALNGSSSYVTLPSGVLNGKFNVTVSLWFKTGGSNEVLFSHSVAAVSAGTTTASFQPWLYVGADGKLVASVGTTGAIESSAPVNNNAWHHLVFAVSASIQSLYVDGTLAGTGTPHADAVDENNIYVGTGFLGGGWPDESNSGSSTAVLKYFNGSISDVALFDSTLNDAQAAELWQGYKNALVSVIPVTKVTVTDPPDAYDAASHTETYLYDPLHSSRLVSYTDALGAITTYGYDTSGFLNTVTDPNGDQTITGHDVRGNVVSQTTCQYEAQNNCQTAYMSYYPDDTTAVLSYPLDRRDDQQVTTADARSSSKDDVTYRTSYTLDPNGDRTVVTTPAVTGFPSGRTTTTAYTDGTSAYACGSASVVAPVGLVSTITTPAGAVANTSYHTTTSYYANGDTCQVTDADGLVTRFTYDGLGRVATKTVISDTYPSGLVTTYTYDGLGHVAATTAPTVTEYVITANHNHTAQTSTVYDVDGNVTSQTVADTTGGDTARTVYYSYNQDDQKVTSSDARSANAGDTTYQTTYAYDNFGNVQKQIDPLGHATQYLYDADNRLRTTTLLDTAADGTSSSGTNLLRDKRLYDAGGRLQSVTDAQGYTANYLYYDNNLVYQVSQTDGNHTYIAEQDTYDAAGNLVKKLTNNTLTETDYAYDSAGRTTSSVLDPSGTNRTTTTVYSPDDKAVSTTVADGLSGTASVTNASYDALGNPLGQLAVGYSSGAPSGWWDLSESGSAPMAPDSSGHSDTATLNSGVTYTGQNVCIAGFCGAYPSFNGTSGQITASGPAVNTTSSYSVSAWVNLTSDASNITAVSQSGTSAAAFLLQNDAATKAWRVSVTTADSSSPGYIGVESAVNSVTTGAWTLLTATADTTTNTLTLYVNGAKAGSTALPTLWNASGPLVIGAAKAAGSMAEFFPGGISNVQTYQRALTAADVSALNKAGAQGLPLGTNTTSTAWTRDSRGLPTMMSDGDGNLTHYTYDESGRLAVTTSPTVKSTTVDPATGAVTYTNGVAVTSTGYDTFGEVTESKDAMGNETQYIYDAAGNKTTATSPSYLPPGASSAITATTLSTYNADSELTAAYDPIAYQNGATSPTAQYAYNNFGLQHSATDVAGNVATYGYDSDGDRTSTTVTTPTDSTGVKSSATYDYLGNTSSSTQIERYPSSATNTTNYNYDPTTGWLTSATLPSNNTPESYTYNNLGQKTKTTDKAGNVTTYAYDYAGRVVQTTLPDTTYAKTTYDVLGDATSNTSYDSHGATLAGTSAAFDGVGRMTSSTDALGNTSTYSYDATGLLTGESQPATCLVSTQTPCGYTTINVGYGYDLNGNRTAYADGNGNGVVTDTSHTTYTTYNRWGRPETTIEPAASASTYTALPDRTTTNVYDLNGRLSSQTVPGRLSSQQTVPGAVTTTYQYNPTGTLASESATGAEVATATRAFGYDAFGDVTSDSTTNTSTTSTSNASSESFTYDDRGHLLTTGGSAGNSSFSYNSDGLMASRADGGRPAATYGYDTQDRLQTVADPLTGVTATYTYTPQSQVNDITYGSGGDKRTYTYDNLHRVTGDALTSGATAVNTLTYSYDAAGQLKSKTDANGVANTYTYDLAGRLTNWNNGTSTTRYAYDQDSNRTQVGANLYTYDQRDELTSDGTSTYSYTARGTMTAKTATSTGTTLIAYTSDAYGQQTTAGTGTYAYDGSGRLLSRTTTSTTSLQYTGTGNTLASDGSQYYSRDPGGGLFAAYLLSTGAGRLLATDQHNDVVGDFTPTGTGMDGVQTYDPLGNTITRTGSMANVSVGYQSEFSDSSTGEINMAARWYNPATGQFTSKDSVTNSATPNTANANPFGYANASPLLNTDPSGHMIPVDPGTCPPDQYFSQVSRTCVPRQTGGGGDNTGGGGGGGGGNDPTTIAGVSQDASHQNIANPNDGTAGSTHDCNQLGDVSYTDVGNPCYGKVIGAGVVSWGASTLDFFTGNGKYNGGFTFSGWWDEYTARHWGIGQGSDGAQFMHDVSNVINIAFAVAGGGGAIRDAAALPKGAGALARLRAGLGSLFGVHGSADDASGASALDSVTSTGSANSDLNDVKALSKLKQNNNTRATAPDNNPPNTTPASHNPDPTTVAKAPTQTIPEQLTVKAVDPVPVEATTATTAAPETANAVVEESTSAAAKPDAGTDGPSASCTAVLTHSFTGATPVLMPDGSTKAIDQVKVGDQITDAVPGQSTTQTHTVTNVIVTKTDHDFVDLAITRVAEPAKAKDTTTVLKKSAIALAATLALATAASTTSATGDASQHGGTLTTTFHHPFYDITQAAFVDAQNLKPGDELQTPTGTAEVTSVRLFHANTVTYDLTIGALHTYYVVAGSTPVLVHNVNLDGCPTTPNTHFADVTVHAPDGGVDYEYDIRSGAQTPPEQAMGTRNGATLSHTENRVSRMSGGAPMIGGKTVVGDEFFGEYPVQEGGFVVINGTRSPCGNCISAMNGAAEDTGATFVYTWQDEVGNLQWWQSGNPLRR